MVRLPTPNPAAWTTGLKSKGGVRADARRQADPLPRHTSPLAHLRRPGLLLIPGLCVFVWPRLAHLARPHPRQCHPRRRFPRLHIPPGVCLTTHRPSQHCAHSPHSQSTHNSQQTDSQETDNSQSQHSGITYNHIQNTYNTTYESHIIDMQLNSNP